MPDSPALSRMRAIVDAAAAESRELSAAEEAELTALDDELAAGSPGGLAAAVRAVAGDLSRIAAAKATSDRPATPRMARDRELGVQRLRSLARHAAGHASAYVRELCALIERSPRPSLGDVDAWHAGLARLGDELAASLALEASALDSADIRRVAEPIVAAHARTSSMTPESSLAGLWSEYRERGFAARDFPLQTRALATSSHLVEGSYAARVLAYQRTFTPMLNPEVVTISTSASGESFTIPRLTTDTATGGTITAQAGTINAADPTISSVVLTPFKYASISLWSAELDADAVYEIEDLIARSTARDLGLGAGVHLTTGTGTTQPFGIVTQATNGGTAAGTAVSGGDAFFGWPDLIDLYGSVAAPYRSQGAYMMSPDALAKVLTWRDSSGHPIWDLGSGGRLTILGRPVYENPAMAAVASASKSVLFGDLSRYVVRRVTPLRIELTRDYKFDTDQVALKTVERLDGNLVDTAAVAYLVSANT